MAASLSSRLVNAAVRAYGAVPPRLRHRLVRRPVVVQGQMLHPDIQLVLALLNAAGDTFETKPLAQARAELEAEAHAFGTRPRVALVEDLTIPTPAGPLGARRYRAAAPSGAPAPGVLMYLHGGGWVLGGGPASSEAVCRRIARRTGLEVVSVDYRLAPEDPFPAAVEDAVAAFRWLRDHPQALHAEPGRVAVAGESAGGNLACVLAQLTRDDPAGGPVFVCPLLPVTDLSARAPSYALFSEGYFLSAAQMDWYTAHYLADPRTGRVRRELAADPRVSPLLADDAALAGLPPHHVVVAGFDVLRDEGLAYARRLEAAGVEVQTTVAEGYVHAFVDATAVGAVVTDRVDEIADTILAGVLAAG